MRTAKTDQTGRMSLRWAHRHFVGFVMWLISCKGCSFSSYFGSEHGPDLKRVYIKTWNRVLESRVNYAMASHR